MPGGTHPGGRNARRAAAPGPCRGLGAAAACTRGQAGRSAFRGRPVRAPGPAGSRPGPALLYWRAVRRPPPRASRSRWPPSRGRGILTCFRRKG